MTFYSRLLVGEEERDAFASEYAARSGTGVDPQYLGRCTVRGFFGKSGALVGGYAFNYSLPLRYSEMIPATMLEQSPALKQCLGQWTVEISLLWLDIANVTIFQRNLVYWRVWVDCYRTGKKYVLAGSYKRGVARMQKIWMPRIVYAGLSEFRGKPEFLEVYYGRVSAAFFRFWYTSVLFTSAAIRASAKSALKRRRIKTFAKALPSTVDGSNVGKSPSNDVRNFSK